MEIVRGNAVFGASVSLHSHRVWLTLNLDQNCQSEGGEILKILLDN